MASPPINSAPKPASFLHRFWRYHSLGLVVLGIVTLWVVLYARSNPNSHAGAFYGNAIADWAGAWLIIIVTKYLHERGSTESRPFQDRATTPVTRFLAEHSLSLFLILCCLVTGRIFWRMDPNSQWGTVAGNLLSQFVQLLGLVLLTKKLFEKGSKESDR
jgi:hypothetical protein